MRWTLQSKPEKEQVQKLQNELQVDEIIATLLVQRGITTYDQAKTFFRPTLDDLHNPYERYGQSGFSY
jgi:single-stranded-DNA-specific exonuclease